MSGAREYGGGAAVSCDRDPLVLRLDPVDDLGQVVPDSPQRLDAQWPQLWCTLWLLSIVGLPAPRSTRDARAALVETDERMLLQQVGYYQFRHPLDDVLASKQRLDRLRAQIKEAITKRTAVHGKSGWMVNGSLREGRSSVT